MKIVIATGGTGGHLFPALKVASATKELGHEIILLGSFRALALDKVQKCGLPFENFKVQGFNFNNFKSLFYSVGLMTIAVFTSIRSLRKIKPDVVVGFGGYGAFPTVIAAFFLKIPAMIHEQNVVPGRANAILAKLVTRVAMSFQESRKFFNPKKTVLTGCPCNISGGPLDRGKILEAFQLKEKYFTVLVAGGSQGSQKINKEFIWAVKNLRNYQSLQVIHLSGETDYCELKKEYLELGIPFALFKFLDKIEEAYEIADLVIARAGASTVTELVMLAVPSILIPYPHAGGHQKENAKVLTRFNAAVLIEEHELTTQRLVEAIESVRASAINRRDLRERLKNICNPDAARQIAREAIRLKGKK